MDDLAFENLKNKRSKFKGFFKELFEKEEEIPYQTCPVCGSGNGYNDLFCDECMEHEVLEEILQMLTISSKYFHLNPKLISKNWELDITSKIKALI